MKPHAKKQAGLFALISVLLLPVGVLLFVVPGLLLLWVIWKSWASIGEFLTPEEIRDCVAALGTTKTEAASA